ncbi:MAG: type I secretion system permease/ATPase, partial [Pseudomonas sp.]|nr:type I secretion system permease/ATPase [Pseudomonas sp.]
MTRPKANEMLAALTAYKRAFFNIGLFSAVINLLMLAPALYMLQVYDRVLASGNQMTLLMLTLMILGLFGLMGALEWVRSQVVIRLGTQMDMRLNQRVYDAAFEAQLRTGSPAAAQALNDLTSLRQFATGNALFAFFDAPWFPVYLFVIFMFSPWLGLLALGGALLLMILAWVNQHVSQAPLKAASELSVQATQQASAHLRNAEAIEAMGMLDTLRGRWLAQHTAFLAQQNLASEKTATVSAWSKGVRLALQSLVLGLGALLAVQGQITAGMMIAGSILMGRVLSPIDQLIGVWKQWSSARLAYQRLEALLHSYPARVQRMALPAPRGELAVEQLSASAPGTRRATLANLSFTLPAGQVLGVIGPSGCGKSTLARLLIGVWQPLAGKVRLDGAELSQWDKHQLGPHLGYLPQD